MKCFVRENMEFLFFCRQNFILVDIFYSDLKYEQIEQNVAFEFPSLLSEIGGFLGLLLGASVFTLCELVDYVSLLIMAKVAKHREMRRNKVHH